MAASSWRADGEENGRQPPAGVGRGHYGAQGILAVYASRRVCRDLDHKIQLREIAHDQCPLVCRPYVTDRRRSPAYWTGKRRKRDAMAAVSARIAVVADWRHEVGQP
ncbi:MAG: hypothetical protein C0511_13040 [Hyphomicrobium sp.]|nr:hypothetical protein [Hyphomicrobium sp.]